MRQGILYDLLGRFHHNDMRDATVAQFMKRYQVDSRQAQRVEALALHLLGQLSLDLRTDPEYPSHLLSWAARLHEIGLSVAYSGYHKHSAYILTHADMPGFSKMEQAHLALLVLAHRGNMEKMRGQVTDSLDLAMVMALRLAVQLHRSRTDVPLPPMEAHYDGKRFELGLDPGWLASHPLTVASLSDEVKEWKKLGVGLRVRDLEAVKTDEDRVAADGE
jgi:exopolyphosphatase/guanosine-5'-triphosphate,3'-diphosphate pyrophosphatase